MTRPSTDHVLMTNAITWSHRSTCTRAQVGCVISRDGRTLATGYNGAPAGMAHCDHTCDCRRMNYERHPNYPFRAHRPDCRSELPCTNVVHSEANALAFAAKYGVATGGASIHTTRVPCMTCAGLLINAGIIRVVWLEKHRDMTGWARLAEAGLEVVQWGEEGVQNDVQPTSP